jgi:hypothetical protein
MYVKKAKIENGEIVDNVLGKVGLNELESGIADKYFEYEQLMPSAVWYITHNLNKRCSVHIQDSAGSVVQGHIKHVDDNNVELYFSSAFAGKAYCN